MTRAGPMSLGRAVYTRGPCDALRRAHRDPGEVPVGIKVLSSRMGSGGFEVEIIETVREDLARKFGSSGFAVAQEESLTVSTGQWRAIAREVGRDIGRPLKTITVEDDLYAIVMDWPLEGERTAYPSSMPQVRDGRDFWVKLSALRKRSSTVSTRSQLGMGMQDDPAVDALRSA
jgi:hypothetical protein